MGATTAAMLVFLLKFGNLASRKGERREKRKERREKKDKRNEKREAREGIRATT